MSHTHDRRQKGHAHHRPQTGLFKPQTGKRPGTYEKQVFQIVVLVPIQSFPCHTLNCAESDRKRQSEQDQIMKILVQDGHLLVLPGYKKECENSACTSGHCDFTMKHHPKAYPVFSG